MKTKLSSVKEAKTIWGIMFTKKDDHLSKNTINTKTRKKKYWYEMECLSV